MSVACWGGRVGVAWYSQEEGEVRGDGAWVDSAGSQELPRCLSLAADRCCRSPLLGPPSHQPLPSDHPPTRSCSAWSRRTTRRGPSATRCCSWPSCTPARASSMPLPRPSLSCWPSCAPRWPAATHRGRAPSRRQRPQQAERPRRLAVAGRPGRQRVRCPLRRRRAGRQHPPRLPQLQQAILTCARSGRPCSSRARRAPCWKACTCVACRRG